MTIKQNIQEKDGTTLRNIISEACLAFKNHSTFEQEAAFLSRFTYCMKTKLRHCKGLKTIAKVNQALLRYLRMNVLHHLETFSHALPETYSDVMYMPARNMLLYLLVRLQGFGKLMVRLVETTQVAASTLEQLITLGHMWKIYFLAYGIVSRIYTLSRNIVKYACRLYSLLLPFVPVLQNSTVNWLPKSYILPKDPHLWLETECLDDLPENVPTDKPFLSLLNCDMGDSDEELFIDRANIEKVTPVHSVEDKPERTTEDLGIPVLQNSNVKKRRKKKKKDTKLNLQTVDDLKLFEKDFKSNPEKYSDNFKKLDKMQCSMLHKLVLKCLKKSLKSVNNPVIVDACLAEVRSALSCL
ncbi:hypothetical protein PPYR_11476 [Photinus pyralis]|uniref:Nucleolus and neural progenitor protein-like N-terminal domain-containing protein n=2 Tax=Photinus pyralis TaxID=7054 RepID=A0A5N4ABE1_PHOPY|nr:uncharacterized protein LOC116176519 [Photinus pyralis]KAB0794637.1 hypothetical protein PPYR_11476 [Photinus pyralis]